jgi:hypothetical protein
MFLRRSSGKNCLLSFDMTQATYKIKKYRGGGDTERQEGDLISLKN